MILQRIIEILVVQFTVKVRVTVMVIRIRLSKANPFSAYHSNWLTANINNRSLAAKYRDLLYPAPSANKTSMMQNLAAFLESDP